MHKVIQRINNKSKAFLFSFYRSWPWKDISKCLFGKGPEDIILKITVIHIQRVKAQEEKATMLPMGDGKNKKDNTRQAEFF